MVEFEISYGEKEFWWIRDNFAITVTRGGKKEAKIGRERVSTAYLTRHQSDMEAIEEKCKCQLKAERRGRVKFGSEKVA